MMRPAPESRPAGRDLADEVRALAAAQEILQSRLARREHLNLTDMRALEVLMRRGPLTAGALADELGVSTGAVTGIVDRLAEIGHAERRPDPDDRRRVLVIASELAFRTTDQAIEELRLQMRIGLENFTDSELQITVTILRRIRELIDEHSERLRSLASGQG